MITHLRHTIIALALVAGLTALGAPTASADYPPKVAKKYRAQCIGAAKKEADEPLKGAELRAVKQFCNLTLACLEGKVPADELETTKGTDPRVKRCIAKAKKQLAD